MSVSCHSSPSFRAETPFLQTRRQQPKLPQDRGQVVVVQVARDLCSAHLEDRHPTDGECLASAVDPVVRSTEDPFDRAALAPQRTVHQAHVEVWDRREEELGESLDLLRTVSDYSEGHVLI